MPALAVTVIIVTVEFPSQGTHYVGRVKWCADGAYICSQETEQSNSEECWLKVIHSLYVQSLTISGSANRDKSLFFES